METSRVEIELFGNARAYTWLLPQPGTLNVLAGVARIVARTRLLEHTTADACASLANLLHFFPPGVSETATDLGLGRLLVYAEVGCEVGLGVWVDGDWS